ncbi:MAG: protease HtpX [Proteobacteria bacterium]|nr:protease HtpX [Pseudomonadota bacterium]
MLRMLLFFGTNLAIIIVLSISMRLLGVDSILEQQGGGLNLTSLLIFSAVFGMGGSLISLAISKWMAKKSMGVQLIGAPSTKQEQWLVSTVEMQAREAGIDMPELGLFNSPQPNAFATGMNKNSALVAISTGLLENMTQDEVEAVLGHEISHVANGDMVTLSLIQGVVNTFVIFFSRIIGHLLDRLVFKIQRGHGPGFWIGVIFVQMILSVLASTIVMWFSRRREFKADAGGAYLAGREKMISALRRLQQNSNPQPLPDEMAAFGISGGVAGGFKRLFMSHPPLEERIAALEDNWE